MATEVGQTAIVENKTVEESAMASDSNAAVEESEKTANNTQGENCNAASDKENAKASANNEEAKKDGDGAAPPASKAETPKFSVHKTNFEKDVIYLYQFSRTPLLPSLSPYCLKVETWLRLAGLKYEVRGGIEKLKYLSKKLRKTINI